MEKITFNHGLSVMWPPKKLLLIMKLIIVLMTTFLMQVSAAGFAQKITYAKKGATLEQIFTEIRKQTGYFVVYAEDKVDKQTKMDVYFKNTDLTDVLDVISKSQDLSYSFNEKNIGLKPKEKSYLETVIDRFQAIDVQGRVLDSLGNGLPGATVSVKGTKSGTTTLPNGNFYLKNIEDEAVLVISYLGYVTKEVVANKEFMYIGLQQSTSKLDEIQVMAYGKTSRRISTGNIATISSEDLGRQPVDNPLYALQGRVPGLMVMPTSGTPNAPVKLQLRGQNSINGQMTEPLIVIDGVPFRNNIPSYSGATRDEGSARQNGGEMSALGFINSNDIESISILKVCCFRFLGISGSRLCSAEDGLVSIALSCQEEG
ncbi:STN domain-containing protein [Pedobacter sp. GR22-6]|uniref:STN domain-containing protein n=1 Tax=Pedobacter sp. GR22-6 TaxID=3127957 RepID=UPI00307DAC67